MKPKEATGLDMAFGPSKISDWMPSYGSIPEEFKDGDGKWNRFFNDAFFTGVKNISIVPKDGIDSGKAMGHLKAIMRSFEPRHEHKEAAFAYLASQWFEDITYEVTR